MALVYSFYTIPIHQATEICEISGDGTTMLSGGWKGLGFWVFRLLGDPGLERSRNLWEAGGPVRRGAASQQWAVGLESC